MKAAMIGDNCIDVYRCIDGKEVTVAIPPETLWIRAST